MRADFLGMVSHELRAPLMSIKGSTTTVLSASLTPNPAESLPFFRVIDEQADHMIGLIADLLDQGRIEAGTLSVSPEPADVAGLVDQARKTLLSSGIRHTDQRRPARGPATGDGRPATPRSGPQQPLLERGTTLPRVVADRCLGGAGRDVRCGHGCRSRPGSAARSVAPPLPETRRDRGGRSDRAGRLRAWPAHLPRAGGGARRSHLGPERGRGPRHADHVYGSDCRGNQRYGDSGRQRAPDPAPDRQESQRAQILVVDDDPQMLRYFRDALMAEGYAPIVTGDPNEVASLVRTRRPALVILDLRLPGVDGIELMEADSRTRRSASDLHLRLRQG